VSRIINLYWTTGIRTIFIIPLQQGFKMWIWAYFKCIRTIQT